MNANRAVLCACVLALLLASTGLALAQGGPAINWSVVGSGGGRVAVDGYTLDVTVGQPVVGTAGADPYQLCAGFWCAANAYDVFLPLVLREA
jgi:hypothetical protein